jgi:hypothetical protein
MPPCHCGLYECMGPDNVRPGFACKKNQKCYHTIRVQQRALESSVRCLLFGGESSGENRAMKAEIELERSRFIEKAARELEGV